jgi:hypothetical protein
VFSCWEPPKLPLYELEYVNMDEQYGTKVHMLSLHTTLALQLNLGQPIFNSSQILAIPTKSQRLQINFLRFDILALWCRPISGWAAPSIPRFTYSQLCNGQILELLVLCKQVSLESITDTRPSKVMPMVGAFRSCSRVYLWVSLRLPISHGPWPHSQSHIGVFLKYTLQGDILSLMDLRIH